MGTDDEGIKGHVTFRILWMRLKPYLCCTGDASLLARRNCFHGLSDGGPPFHFDKSERIMARDNQINFSRYRAIAPV